MLQAEGTACDWSDQSPVGCGVSAIVMALQTLHLSQLPGKTCPSLCWLRRQSHHRGDALRPCQESLSATGLSFLLDESDTVLAYENKGKTSEETRQHDPLMSALDNLNRVQQLEIIHGRLQ